MRKVIQHFIHLSLLVIVTAGNAASTELREQVRKEHATASAYSLALSKKEIQVLHPFSTVQQKPFFYRVGYTRGEQNGCVFLLGTCHPASISVLPIAVMRHIDQATYIITEENSGDYIPSSRADSIKLLLTKYPLSSCMQNDGTSLLAETGWLSLVHIDHRDSVENFVTHRMGTELAKDIFHINPCQIYAQIHQMREADLGLPTNDDLDFSLAEFFRQKNRRILGLESETSRSALLQASGEEHPLGTIEENVKLLTPLCLGTSISGDILEEIQAKHANNTRIVEKYYTGENPFEGPDKIDLGNSIRNQHWINNTLKISERDSIGFIAVGLAHLDTEYVLGIGNTGLLNFFQALRETGKTWNGIQVNGIERLMGANPDSDLTSERNLYEWVPAEGIPTRGRYLREMMAELP